MATNGLFQRSVDVLFTSEKHVSTEETEGLKSTKG